MILFFLFIMSLLVLSLLNSTFLELRLSKNMIIASQQFWAAEIALKSAENRLKRLTIAVPELYEQFNFAEFQFNTMIKQHPTHFCFNKRLAYIYDVIVKTKQIGFGVVNLKSTYAIELKEACHGDKFKLAKIGRMTWREFNIPS